MSNDWRLTVADALRRPSFQHARAVAGSKGLARSIRWVHILESAETGKFLNGGELILSTGMGFGEARQTRLAYLAELIHRQAAGLCVELGSYIPQIPQDMLEMADHHQFPLIVFDEPVRFVDITLDLHEHLINQQLQVLRNLESYSRGLQQLSLRSQGTGKLLQFFQSAVQTQVFLYTPETGTQFIPPLPQAVQGELSLLIREQLAGEEHTAASAQSLVLSETKQLVYQPVIAMGHLLAHVGMVLYEREPDEFLLLTLDNTVNVLAQMLMRKMFVDEQTRAAENRLFDELIANRPLAEEQMRSLLGLSESGHAPVYHMLIASFAHEKEADLPAPHDLTAVFRSLFTRLGFRPYIRCIGNRFYLLAAEKQPLADQRRVLDRAMGEMKRIFQQAMGSATTIRFGVSRAGKRLADASKHLAEAEQALAFCHESPSPYFADLGLFRLLFHVPQEPVLKQFIHDYLGPLLRHDEQHDSALVHTLRVYLDTGMSKQETAEKLFIHRQTLYHRLEKIASCIGDDFHTPHRRLCLEIALRALGWVNRGDGEQPANG
ncbi:PucR family transcriptional regulator [Brevibacillus sp. TJ4]|uniref:PucR family transcriptional regulator n=1 Tax=Brevibacillus sp. TJ4 TaxID=3234853 RepID=UPI003BA24F50